MIVTAPSLFLLIAPFLSFFRSFFIMAQPPIQQRLEDDTKAARGQQLRSTIDFTHSRLSDDAVVPVAVSLHFLKKGEMDSRASSLFFQYLPSSVSLPSFRTDYDPSFLVALGFVSQLGAGERRRALVAVVMRNWRASERGCEAVLPPSVRASVL